MTIKPRILFLYETSFSPTILQSFNYQRQTIPTKHSNSLVEEKLAMLRQKNLKMTKSTYNSLQNTTYRENQTEQHGLHKKTRVISGAPDLLHM